MADALAAVSPAESLWPLYQRRAYLGINERSRLPTQYGSLTAEQLTSTLLKLQRGEVDSWADLVQYALRDDLFIHLYGSRISRVAQADYQIVPNEFGNQRLAKQAADFVNAMVGRVENWDAFVRNALHAIALGYSANEIEWDRDGVNRINYVRAIHYINPNRFRYDDQWKLRLYDHGSRALACGNMYGEPLWPSGWVVHQHNELAGDPCDAGLMRSCIWRWLFRRWADTFWIQNLEQHGAPWIHAKVQPNTPEAVRQVIKDSLTDWSIGRAAVIETGGEIVVTPPAMGTGSASQHELYMDFCARSLTATWLGASDVTQPGENGSEAAVKARISATTDPKMITDGTNFCGTLHRSLFKWMIQYNLHLFDGVPPIPKMQFKTATDEQTTDAQDLAAQNAADARLGTGEGTALPYEVRGDTGSPGIEQAIDGEYTPPPDGSTPNQTATTTVSADPGGVAVEKKADTALNGAQVTSLLEVIQSVVDGQLPRASAVVIIETAFNLPSETANRMLGTVGTSAFTPAADPAAAAAAAPPPMDLPAAPPPQETTPPKAARRQGRHPMSSNVKTSQTSSPSIGPLETVLRNMSAGQRR